MKKNGRKVQYDGILCHRNFPPPSESYLTIAPKGKVSAVFDVSKAYSVKEPGTFTVSVDIPTLYLDTGLPETSSTLSLKSPSVSFTLDKKASVPRKTSGEIQRESESIYEDIQFDISKKGRPYRANVVGDDATKERKELIEALSISTYYYANASALEVMEDEGRFKTWFGDNLSNRKIVRDNYIKILRRLESTAVMYYQIFGQDCDSGCNAYTHKNSRTIYFCPPIFDNKPMATNRHLVSILSIMIHELTHAVFSTDDIKYGVAADKKLAKDDPSKAIINADNYELFSSTTYPFNYGIDAMSVLPNGYVYIMKDNFYARLGKGGEDPFTLDSSEFPLPIRGNWGDLIPRFYVEGFDSMFRCGDENRMFVTKAEQYVGYSDKSASKVGKSYPLDIKGNFGLLTKKFDGGFDSGSALPNGYTYVTKGGDYVLYKDKTCSTVTAIRSIAGNWGDLPLAFLEGFDSMMSVSGKTYITKGKQYVRYSDKSGSIVDEGYPKDIRGNFGKANK